MELLTKASWSDEVTQREKDNLQVAYRAASESIVMLKNDGALPFAGKKVALYGPGVSMTIKGGTGSGEVNERHSVTVLEGMEDCGFQVTTKDWISRFEVHYQQKLADELDRLNGVQEGLPLNEDDTVNPTTEEGVEAQANTSGGGGGGSGDGDNKGQWAICPVCGKRFMKREGNQIYDSIACANKARRDNGIGFRR